MATYVRLRTHGLSKAIYVLRLHDLNTHVLYNADAAPVPRGPRDLEAENGLIVLFG